MKKLFKGILTGAFALSLASCGSTVNTSSTSAPTTVAPTTVVPTTVTPTTVAPTTVTPTTVAPTTVAPTTSVPTTDPIEPKLPKIYLAGDSTVKTYETNQYIGGWGQYLDYFLDDSIEVINCAQGGRSSRSFINEGRLYDIEGNDYTFSQNDGKSIGSVIEEGDYLFIQFGHNDDDTKKASSYATLYDRMVPLGTPDGNGIYPTTAGERVATTYLPEEYTSNVSSTTTAMNEIAKYGSTYYSYDCGGTYKWFLKQYIDFAREKNAIPVLVTPVSRVKFSDGQIIGGPGLHGENFAYVEAVRQLAKEEDCLLIDLFSDTKQMLEDATPTYANYLMALKPNDLQGVWPSGYDETYNNTKLGYTGIEATHYNKYGAYLTAAHVIENILDTVTSANNGKETYTFKSLIKTIPSAYIDPSNLISKSVVGVLEGNLTKIKVTNPNRTYSNPLDTVSLINNVLALTLSKDNVVEYEEAVLKAQASYISLNVDDRASVTNYKELTEAIANLNALKESLKPKPISTTVINANNLTAGTYTDITILENVTIYANASKAVDVKTASCNASYGGVDYSFTQGISLGGSASMGTYRCLEIETKGKCTITVIAKSSGTDDRVLNIVKSSSTSTSAGSFEAKASVSVSSQEITEAGKYMIGSTNKGIWVFAIIIEYYE